MSAPVHTGGWASPRFKRSLQLLPSPKSLSCCVRNVPPKQKAFPALARFLYMDENRLQKWWPGRGTSPGGGQGERCSLIMWLWTQVRSPGP